MLKVGRYLKTQGKFAAAEKTLSDALQYKTSEKEEIEINIELISLYEKFGRDQKHLETSRSLAQQFSKGSYARSDWKFYGSTFKNVSANSAAISRKYL